MTTRTISISIICILLFSIFSGICFAGTTEVVNDNIIVKAVNIAPLNLIEWVTKSIQGLLLTLLTWGFVFLRGLIKKYLRFLDNDKVLDQVEQSIEAGVEDTYETYVREIKKAKDPSSPGGTSLTKEERKEARDKTIAFARSFLKKQGIELFDVVSEELIPTKIKEYIAMFKLRDSSLSKEVKKI